MIEQMEKQLDSFDAAERKDALMQLCEQAKAGKIELAESGEEVNLHCHTFFSYNSYGYSPSKYAWLCKKRGLAVTGVVDFDVLDAVDEFLQACRLLGLKGCAGIETRVFVPEFSTRQINSPGEPGISYHMGMGFITGKLGANEQLFLDSLSKTAKKRNMELTERVNKYLSPLELDYKADVLVLTPSGNATERHICLAYARKAQQMFAGEDELAGFWSEKLGVDAKKLGLPEGRDLLNSIRAKTMKQGGVGYVKPDRGAFVLMEDMNKFVLASGAIPTITWLNGLSDGERSIKELIEVEISSGAAAINIIPDRNFTPGVKDEKLEKLYEVVELAKSLDLPVIAGTEMNSPGQKFVDAFDTAELSPLLDVFLEGAYIVYAHSVMQKQCGLGYLSQWAKRTFESAADKNKFFCTLGKTLDPENENILENCRGDITAEKILEKIKPV